MRRSTLFIHLFLALQLLLPLNYYLLREDKNDERFAWRMFSPVHMHTCRTSIKVGTPAKPVNLGRTFHEAWIKLASRGRIMVIEGMGHKVCADNPGERVEVEVRCTGVDRKEVATYGGDSDFCFMGSL
jgi:hypothetical protein